MRLTLVRYGLPIMQPNCVVPGVNFANGAAVTLDLVDAEHRFGLDYQVTIIVLTVRNIGAIRTSCRVLRPLVGLCFRSRSWICPTNCIAPRSP